MRLFVAGFPPTEAVEHLRRGARPLRMWQPTAAGGTIGSTAPDRWHLTLAFLGQVADRRAAIEGALDRAVARWRADASGPPALRLAGGGRFGAGRSTVVWVGVAGAVDELARLADAIRQGLARDGLPYDDRPLRPHLTLGRPGSRLSAQDIQADLTALDGYHGPLWTLDRIELLASHVGTGGGYERLWSVQIGA